jgi:hypothetical protein
MNVQMKALAAACALVAANSAMALTAGTATAANTIFLSGSSALKNDLINEIVGTLCQAGTADMYRDSAGGGNFVRFECSATAQTGIAAGTAIAVEYRQQGGSFFGGAPVGSYAIGKYVVNASAGCPASAPITAGATPVLGAVGNCTGWVAGNAATAVQAIPEAGIMDEEPALFAASLNQPSSCASAFGDSATCGSASTKNYVTTPVLIQAMGIVASTPLITALTKAGSVAGGKANLAANWITTAFSSASSVQTDIVTNTNLAGNGDWAPLSDLVSASTGVTTAPFNGSVILCRRAAGSGTQAALNARFMQVGCGSGISNTPASAALSINQFSADGVTVTTINNATPTTVPTTGFYEVYENGSSGAVKTCMLQAATAGHLALGILSVDQGTGAGYDFVAIDGAAPTDTNITNGVYNYTVESVINKANGLTASKGAIVDALIKAATSVATSSPAGVYNVLTGVAGSVTGNSGKSFKGTTAGVTCRHTLF